MEQELIGCYIHIPSVTPWILKPPAIRSYKAADLISRSFFCLQPNAHCIIPPACDRILWCGESEMHKHLSIVIADGWEKCRALLSAMLQPKILVKDWDLDN